MAAISSRDRKRAHQDDETSSRLSKKPPIGHPPKDVNDQTPTESQQFASKAKSWFAEQRLKHKRESAVAFKAELASDREDVKQLLSNLSEETLDLGNEAREELVGITDRIRNSNGRGAYSLNDDDPMIKASHFLERSIQLLENYQRKEAIVSSMSAEQNTKYKQDWENEKEKCRRMLSIGKSMAENEMKKRLGMATSQGTVPDRKALAFFSYNSADRRSKHSSRDTKAPLETG